MTAPQRKAHFRAYPRRRLAFDAMLLHGAGWSAPVRVLDVGMGGVGIETTHVIAVADRVTMSLLAPSLWDPLILPGRVAWLASSDTASARAGIAFDGVERVALLALFELLATG